MLKNAFRAALALTLGLGATQVHAQNIVGGGASGMPTMSVPASNIQGMSGSSGVSGLSSPPNPFSSPSSGSSSITSGSTDTSRIYAGFEYLLWDIPNRSVRIPVGTVGDTNSLGVLNQPATSLLGGNSTNYGNWTPGMKLNFGVWYDDNHSYGSNLSFLWMFSQKSTYMAQSDGNGNPVISRPFFDTLFATEDVRLLSFPGANTGGYLTQSTVRMWGAEVNPLICSIFGDSTFNLSFLTGFKYLYFNETYNIRDSSNAIGPGSIFYLGNAFGAGYGTSVLDHVVAANHFYGWNLGLQFHGELSNFLFDVAGKVAIGANEEVVDIYGATTLLRNNVYVQGTPGGLLAQPSNSGSFDKFNFAVMPELNASIGYRIIPGVEIHLTYSLMYVSSFVRAPDQLLARQINSGIVPSSPNYGVGGSGPAPVTYLDRSDFTAQSIGINLTLSY